MDPIKILLVDDSKSARYALRLHLQHHGVQVDTADSAEAALERIAETRPQAVLMDHTMPGMNGFEALDILKSDRRHGAYPRGHVHIPRRPGVRCPGAQARGPDRAQQGRRRGQPSPGPGPYPDRAGCAGRTGRGHPVPCPGGRSSPNCLRLRRRLRRGPRSRPGSKLISAAASPRPWSHSWQGSRPNCGRSSSSRWKWRWMHSRP